MSKTYSFPTETKNARAERSWERRWTKKFGTWQKPITVPASMIQDLPPVPMPDLSEFLPVDYRALETRAVDSLLTGPRIDVRRAQDMLIDWEKAMTDVQRSFVSSLRTMPVTVDATMPDTFVAPKPKGGPWRKEGETNVSSSYLHSVYEPEAFQRTVDIIVELMRPHVGDFDAIAFRGSSGAALAYPVAYLLKKPLIHVRKDLGHSYSKLEGLMGARRIAIVDDFVASGTTLRTIMQELVDGYLEKGYAAPVLAHLFLYAERCSSSEGSVRGTVGEILEGCEIHLAYDR